MKHKSLIVGCVFILAGCTAIPSAEQLAQDNQWQALGVQDGEMGYVIKSVNQLHSLNPTATSPDEKAIRQYRAGYQQGLTEFCQLDNAYFLGLSGQEYNHQCSKHAQAREIEKEWQNGLDDFFLGLTTDFES